MAKSVTFILPENFRDIFESASIKDTNKDSKENSKYSPGDLIEILIAESIVQHQDALISAEISQFRSELEEYGPSLQGSIYAELTIRLFKTIKDLCEYAIDLREADVLFRDAQIAPAQEDSEYGVTDDVIVLSNTSDQIRRFKKLIDKLKGKLDLDEICGDKLDPRQTYVLPVLKRIQRALANHINSELEPILQEFNRHLMIVVKGFAKGYLYIDSPETNKKVFDIIGQQSRWLLSALLATGLDRYQILIANDSVSSELTPTANKHTDFSLYLVNAEQVTIDTLNAAQHTVNLSISANERKKIEEDFRRSNTARSLRLLNAVSETNPEEGKIKRIVKQLEKFGVESVCAHIEGLSARLEYSAEQLQKVRDAFTIHLKIQEEEKKNVETAEAGINELSLPKHTFDKEIPEEDANIMKTLMLDELGLNDSELADTLIAKCSLDYLTTIFNTLKAADPLARNYILMHQPQYLYPESSVPLTTFIGELQKVTKLCIGHENYDALNINKCPEHFSTLELLQNTAKAAKILKQMTAETREKLKTQAEAQKVPQELDRLAAIIDHAGIDGKLCVAVVLNGFWYNGILHTGTRILRKESVRKNLPFDLNSSNAKDLSRVIKYLIDNKVIMAHGKRGAVDEAISLQNDLSEIENNALRELLKYTFDARIKKN